MNASIGMAVLINWIRKELSEGNPLLGLARLNENMESNSPIRRAILVNFSLNESSPKEKEVIQRLLKGSKFSEFSIEEQSRIILYKKSVSIRSNKSIPSNIGLKLKRGSRSDYSRRTFRASKRVSNLS